MSASKRKKAAKEAAMKAASKLAKYNKQQTKSKKPKKEFKEYVPTYAYRPEEKHYPSVTTTPNAHATAKKESQQYTGDYITGIATSHKSNLVPVSRGIDPADYAQMRR